MRTTKTMTISLPPGMVKEFEKVRKAENRTRSELVREALRYYIESRFRIVEPTKAELAAINHGRSEIERGDFINFEELIDDLAAANRKKSRKSSQKASR